MTLVEHRIAGEKVAGPRTIDVENPATAEAVRQVGLADRAQVQRTIAAAQDALPAWRDTPAAKRAQVMFRFKMLLERDADAIVALLSEEHGKTLEDAMGELKRGIENVEYACGVPELLKGNTPTTPVPASIPFQTTSRWAWLRVLPRLTSQPWFLCGCFRWRLPAVTRSF